MDTLENLASWTTLPEERRMFLQHCVYPEKIAELFMEREKKKAKEILASSFHYPWQVMSILETLYPSRFRKFVWAKDIYEELV